jgi:multiple sugar transport system substrate-binding protein
MKQDYPAKRGLDRRRFLKVAGATAAAAALAPLAKAPAQMKGLTLRTIIHLYPPTQAIMALLPEYEKETGVKVVFDQIPFGEGYAKQMAELSTAGARYDMLTPWSFWSNGEIATGQLEVLDDYIAKAGGALDFNDFVPVQRDLFKLGGYQYGVPISSQTHYHVYRKDIYAAAGITPPKDGTFTIDAFEATVKKLHMNQKDVFGAVWAFKPLGACFQDWSGLFHSADGHYFDERLNPILNSPTGVACGEWMKGMLQYMPPDVLSYGNQERDETFQRGLAVHQVTFPLSRVPPIFDPQRSKVQDKVIFTTVPFKGINGVSKFEVAPSMDEGWAFVINKKSKNKKEAFDFILWASNKDRQKRMALESTIAPARVSLYADKDIRQKHGWLVAGERQLKANEAAKKAYPKLPEFGEMTEIMGGELSAAFAGQYTVKQALDRANGAIATLLKERGYKVGSHTGKMPWE